jgi:molecular chaperone GrpE
MSAEPNDPPLPEEELPQDHEAAHEIAALRAERDAQKDRALRALAELENLRKRTEREREEARLYSITRFARDLLTVADNLARALAAYPPEARKSADDSTRAVIDGVEATERELQAVLARHGVKAIDAQGQRFDPHLHQAIAEVPGNGALPGTVVNVVQLGYVISDRLLRPAMVTVAKADGPAGTGKLDTKA